MVTQDYIDFCLKNKIVKLKDQTLGIEIEFHDSAFAAAPVELDLSKLVPEKELTEEQMLYWSTEFDPQSEVKPHQIIEEEKGNKT